MYVCRPVRLVCRYVGTSIWYLPCHDVSNVWRWRMAVLCGCVALSHLLGHWETRYKMCSSFVIYFLERNTKMMMEPPERRSAATPGTGGGGGGSFSSTTYVRRRASGGGAALRRLNRASKKMALAGKRRVSSVIRIYSYLEWNDANKCSTS